MKDSFQYNTEIQSIPLIRSDLEKAGLNMGLPGAEMRQLVLIVEELFSRILAAYNGRQDGELLRLSLERRTNHIFLEMRYAAPAVNPLTDTDREQGNPLSAYDGGMGLALIETFMDEVDYHWQDEYNMLFLNKQIRSKTGDE